MKNDNTVVYLLVGAAAVYFLTKKKTLPTGHVAVGPVAVSPYNQQQGMLLPFFNTLLQTTNAIVQSSKGSSVPNQNGSQGMTFTPIQSQQYDSPVLTETNADGSSYYSSGGTFSPGAIDTTMTNQVDVTTPVIVPSGSGSGSSSPDGTDYTDFEDY